MRIGIGHKIKKRLIAAAAAFAVLAGGIGFGVLPVMEASAQEAAETDFEYTILEDGTAAITGYNGDATELEIPRTLGGARVTSIGCWAFSGCDGLTRVSIPEGVTNIGNNAFNNCYGLTKVSIPDSVTKIEYEAFNGCYGLTEIIIPDSVTSIEGLVFEGTFWLEGEREKNPIVIVNGIVIDAQTTGGKVTIPEGVTSIGDYAFQDCGGLTDIIIPEGVTSIGERAFDGCGGLTDIIIPEGVTNIGDGAFYGCRGLMEISIPDSVTSIGDSAFGNCDELTRISIPDSVTSIGNSAFEDCRGLTEVTIPKSVTSIGYYAFQKCDKLTKVNIEGVTSIGPAAFRGCIGLTEVSIPEGVTNIGGAAFEGTPWLEGERAKNPIVIVNNIVIDAQTTSGSVTIPKEVISIGNGAFSNCSGLTEIIIPEGVTTIGDGAFSNCISLTEIIIPEGVTNIGNAAFYGCNGLTEIAIPERVTNIGREAFENCISISNITIPSTVITIGDYAFGYKWFRQDYGDDVFDSDGTYVQIPGFTIYGYTYSAAETYANQNGFEFVEIGKLTEGDWAYTFLEDGTVEIIGYTGNDVELELPKTLGGFKVTKIGDFVFSNCSGLEEVSIPEGVVNIGFGAFVGCSGLKEVSIPEGVTNIGDFAFSGCSGLKEISISDSVTRIGESAFGYGYDSAWTTVKIPGFTIYGYADSAAETYAKENDFIFIEIKEAPTEKPTEAPTEESMKAPTEEPTEAPTEKPTETPTETPTEESTQTPSDAAITVDATGELAPKLEMTKNEILSSISKLFTEEQLEAIRTGAAALDIILDVTNIDDSISENDKELIDKAIADIPDSDKLNFKVMNYLDIKLGALIGGKSFAVTEADGMITVSVAIEKPANGIYKVVRIHDGRTDVIDSQLSKDGTRLSFKTDKFSTYAIIYSDVASGDGTSAVIIVMLIIVALAAGSMTIVSAKRRRAEKR